MKFYVIEYDEGIANPRRIIETSKARTEAKLLNLLQIDAFGTLRPPPSNVRLLLLDIPTPVRQDIVKDLLSGDIYKYRVDAEGNPAPQPMMEAPSSEQLRENEGVVLNTPGPHAVVLVNDDQPDLLEVEPDPEYDPDPRARQLDPETVPADDRDDEDLPF